MHTTRVFTLSLFVLFVQVHLKAQVPSGFEQTPRQKTCINQNWKFKKGNPEGVYFLESVNDTNWQNVNIPHTLALTSLNLDDCTDDKTQATFHRDVGWYRRYIEVSKSDRRIFLEFEGAHQVTTLWINGEKVGTHSIGGYTPFHFEITDIVVKGQKNLITLLVDNRKREDVPPDPGPFDYIKFSGLYRDVYLVETNSVRIPFNWENLESGVTFTTPSVDPINGNATISVKTTVENGSNSSKNITVINRIIDKTGKVILKLVDSKMASSGERINFNQIGGIETNLQLWSTQNPYLYRLNTLIYEDQTPIDGVECKVGIRKFEHHPREGFLLNGESIKLIGMNRHQQFAYVGDAVPNSLHRKDMIQFKELGFNVVRTAHYPQDDALLEACDELGILVYEEAPTWINIGNEVWFDNLEKAARIMVRNHRNHPSVVIWGAGINHRGYVPRMHYAIKQEDPNRLTASQSSRWTGWQTSGLTDIYGQMIYGPVDWKRHEPMLAMEGRDGILDLAPYMLDPLLTGLIAWTAHDYYTFHPSPDEDRVRNAGIMDLFRQPYTETHFYPIELKRKPELYIASDWTNSTNEVVVYSNAEEVELSVNDKVIARKQPNREGLMNAFKHPPFRFKIDQFEAGKLTAKGLVDGTFWAEQTINTPKKATDLKLIIDTLNRSFIADGSDLVLAYAHLVDENGTIVKNEDQAIQFRIEGDASIIGNEENIGANPINSKGGIAPVLIRAGLKSGSIKLLAEAEGLKTGMAEWNSEMYNNDFNHSAYQPFYDMNTVQVDLGANDQLVQFDWKAWNEDDGKSGNLSLNLSKNVNASLKTATEEGLLRWLGEMNVMGKFGYAYGEGVLALDDKGLVLQFDQLPAGNYELSTFHHAPRSNTDSMDPNREQLKLLNLTKIPYARNLNINLKAGNSNQSRRITITEGKILPETGPGKCTFKFKIEEPQTVRIHFKGEGENKYVWLNAFVLSQIGG